MNCGRCNRKCGFGYEETKEPIAWNNGDHFLCNPCKEEEEELERAMHRELEKQMQKNHRG